MNTWFIVTLSALGGFVVGVPVAYFKFARNTAFLREMVQDLRVERKYHIAMASGAISALGGAISATSFAEAYIRETEFLLMVSGLLSREDRETLELSVKLLKDTIK